ncbi:MAG: hypothetical protein R2864_12620 [Syntrophotaleaceae bacterium]
MLDVYCGMGNLSLPVADLVDEVVGWRGFFAGHCQARLDAQENDVANAVFHHMPAEGATTLLSASPDSFDLVMLDPPRCGAHEVAKGSC